MNSEAIVAPLDRQGGQLQGGDPAFSCLAQERRVRGGKTEMHRPVEIGGGFVVGKAQVGGADFDELAPRPSRASGRAGSARVLMTT